jgi:hypothetical protein
MASRVIFGEEYKLRSSSLHNSRHSSVTFSLSDLYHDPILEHPSPIVCHNVIDQVSHPYKTTGKIIPVLPF